MLRLAVLAMRSVLHDARVDPAAPRSVRELRGKAGDARLDGKAPEADDLGAHPLARLGVALPVARQVVDRDRIAPDDGALAAVQERPAEGVDRARDHGNALLHRDHQRTRMQRPWMAEPLPCPLDVDADELP